MPERLRVPIPVTVLIEIPRGGIIKRTSEGALDFISPIPCPFNYGCLEHTTAPDGDPVDAIVLGPRLTRGVRVRRTTLAVFGFLDRGSYDPKLVCGIAPLRGDQRRAVETFFARYVWFKRGLQRLRGQTEPTEVLGWMPWTAMR